MFQLRQALYSEFSEADVESEKPSILLVEDHAEMAKYLCEKLETTYRVICARNRQAALEQLGRISSLDIIISDVMMEDLDGFQFCKLVFEREKFSHIPFIFLTAKASSEDRIRGLELGAIDYIEKPFKIQELLTKIDSIFSNLKKQREAVITAAYKSILSDSDGNKKVRSASQVYFFDNCKKYRLTTREIDIVKLLIKGQPYKIIGDNLNISAKTVAKHISNIFSKVGVGNKVELINKLEFSELVDISV